mgnify:CR=1 FL=1
MKRLILMRHAKSDWSGAGVSDHDRTLNDRGRRDAAALGQWLRIKGLAPDTVLCSSATRTRQTVDLLGLDGTPDVVLTRALYLADAEELHAALCEATGETVLLVAHNPGIGDMAEMIVDAEPNPDGLHHYPTGATLVATFQIDDWADLKWQSGHVTHRIVPRDLAAPE